MDGYIKSKTDEIRNIRKAIFYKYLMSFVIAIFIPVLLFAMAVRQPPSRWTHTEAVFSSISQEPVGLRHGRSYVFNSVDGRQFVINEKDTPVDDLRVKLAAGRRYALVYSETIAGGNIIEALSDDDTVLQALDVSISRWRAEQRRLEIALLAACGLEIAVLILIDRLGCKKEHGQISALKQRIEQRRARIAKHAE